MCERENCVWEFNGTSKITTSTIYFFGSIATDIFSGCFGLECVLCSSSSVWFCFRCVFASGWSLHHHTHSIPTLAIFSPVTSTLSPCDTIITFNSDRMRIYCFYVFLLHDKWMRMFSRCCFSPRSALWSFSLGIYRSVKLNSCGAWEHFDVRKVHFHQTNFIMWWWRYGFSHFALCVFLDVAACELVSRRAEWTLSFSKQHWTCTV